WGRGIGCKPSCSPTAPELCSAAARTIMAGMEPRRGLSEKDLANPRRAKPATVGMTLLLIIGGLVMGSSLAINFFTGYFSLPTFLVGIVLFAIAVVYFVFHAFSLDAETMTSSKHILLRS